MSVTSTVQPTEFPSGVVSDVVEQKSESLRWF